MLYLILIHLSGCTSIFPIRPLIYDIRNMVYSFKLPESRTGFKCNGCSVNVLESIPVCDQQNTHQPSSFCVVPVTSELNFSSWQWMYSEYLKQKSILSFHIMFSFLSLSPPFSSPNCRQLDMHENKDVCMCTII